MSRNAHSGWVMPGLVVVLETHEEEPTGSDSPMWFIKILAGEQVGWISFTERFHVVIGSLVVAEP